MWLVAVIANLYMIPGELNKIQQALKRGKKAVTKMQQTEGDKISDR